MVEGGLLEILKSLYVLTTSGNRWHVHLLYTLRSMSFKPTCFDLDVWIRGFKGGCDCIGTHTNDVLIVVVNLTYIFNKLKETYTIKSFGLPKVHLDCY